MRPRGKQPADFWGWGEFAPTENRVIENREIKLVEADAEHAVLEVNNDWKVEDQVMIGEETTVATHDTEGVTVIDMEYCLTPQERRDPHGDGLRRLLRERPQGRPGLLREPEGQGRPARSRITSSPRPTGPPPPGTTT